jgi:two-component system chemotaxis response regulator CheB
MLKKIKVLIIDDSAVVREFLSSALNKDPQIEVVGVAPDPYVARDKILSLTPDVLTLDIEMPRMDGLTFLEKLMTYHPIPTIMVSSLTRRGAEVTLKALEIGAIDFVTKPKKENREGTKNDSPVVTSKSRTIIPLSSSNSAAQIFVQELIEKIKMATRVQVKKSIGPKTQHKVHEKNVTNACSNKEIKQITDRNIDLNAKIIAIGASTGGTEAIRSILTELPADVPGTVIVQHMPEKFTDAFAKRLNELCAMEVREAKDGDELHRGLALVAPGNKHMVLKRDGIRYSIAVIDGPRVNHQRPAVDVLFDSVASTARSYAVGILLTGMGKDGASGLLKMKEAGARTIAQDEITSIVFGMPAEAIKLGAVNNVLPLYKIPEMILSLCKEASKKNV